MSTLGEIFAKEFEGKYGVRWEKIVQALASYNVKCGSFDVRLELSGLKGQEEELIFDFFNFLYKFDKPYFFPPFCNKKIFYLVGDSEEVKKRIEIEKRKKDQILPYILEKIKKLTNDLAEELYSIEPMFFLMGSASPRSRKLFWFYGGCERIFVSDVDLKCIIPTLNEEIIDYIGRNVHEFSLKNKIPVNINFTCFSDSDFVFYTSYYPLSIPYREKKNSNIKISLDLPISNFSL